MILKDAFRYQTKLDNIIFDVDNYLDSTRNVTTIKQEHLRKNTNPDAENEIVILDKDCVFEDERITPNVVISFLMDVYEEKVSLTKAIEIAKNNAKIDIDSSIAMNKVRERIAKIMRSLSGIRSGEVKKTATGKKFNSDGEQVSYAYDVTEVTTIDFDRNLTKSLAKNLNAEHDRVSADIDIANITIEVNHTPRYDFDDSFEDCLVKFLDNKSL